MSDIIFLVLRKLRLPLITLVIVYAVATLGMTLIPGVDDKGDVWYMSFFHAFYFVSFMGTTIGFGEIPYAFTDAQRAWVLLCIYTSVFAWLYAIGTTLNLLQNQTFKNALSNQAFQRSIKRIDMPFYIICGYGETGSLINHGLAGIDVQTVIIDRDPELNDRLELLDLVIAPIVLTADATLPDNLIHAGVNNSHCQGVIAVTNDDHTNLKVALNCKLINQNIPVICRSEVEDEANNMASFGTDLIVNPYTTFANLLSLFSQSPALHRIENWFINQLGDNHVSERRPPSGTWILCGYGRLGKAVSQRIQSDNITLVIIDEYPEKNNAPENTIVGRGTEAETLIEAGIMEASVVIAASSDDANNLSILMTAEQINKDIYSIGRINDAANQVLFKRARCDYMLRSSLIVANKVLTLISRPLVTDFIKHSNQLFEQDVEDLIEQIKKVSGHQNPITWRLILDEKHSPALIQHLEKKNELSVEQICAHPSLPKASSVPLLLHRNGRSQLLPKMQTLLQVGDELLLAGRRDAILLAQRLQNNLELVDSLINHNPHHIPLLRWRERKSRTQAVTRS